MVSFVTFLHYLVWNHITAKIKLEGIWSNWINSRRFELNVKCFYFHCKCLYTVLKPQIQHTIPFIYIYFLTFIMMIVYCSGVKFLLSNLSVESRSNLFLVDVNSISSNQFLADWQTTPHNPLAKRDWYRICFISNNTQIPFSYRSCTYFIYVWCTLILHLVRIQSSCC